MSHSDSHTMGDRLEDIYEPPPPIRVEDGEFTPTYDPSPDLAELGPVISEIGPLHDRPTHSKSDSPLTRYRYGIPEDAETHFEPASTSYGSYAMSGFPTHDLAFHVESDFKPNTMPGVVSFLNMQRGLGALVTLHLPSQWWKLHHISLLGLGLAIRLGYQIQDE